MITDPSIYREFLSERDEILKHKWCESVRLGYDIGFERALMEWITLHRKEWKEEREKQHHAWQSAEFFPKEEQ